MKHLNTLVKVLTALAAVAGVIYVVATYGDRIVAWAKNLWASLPQCPFRENPDIIICDECDDAPEAEQAPEEPEAAEPAAEPAVEEPVVAPNEPVAEEQDFAE